jgi:phosphate transporter
LDAEQSPLLDNKTRSNAIFKPALDKELEKIKVFYISKEKDLLEEVDKLISDYAVFENLEDNVSIRSNAYALSRSYQSQNSQRKSISSQRRNRSTSDVDANVSFVSSDEEDAEIQPSNPSGKRRFSSEVDADNRFSYLWEPTSIEEERIRLKKRMIELFVRLSELKSFVSLNYTGFSKILKKYDKITDGEHKLKSSYLNDVVGEAYPFRQSTRQKFDEQISKVQEIYANLCTNANMDIAIKELKAQLREFIVWERNTIWRDIIGLERKSHAVGIKAPVISAGGNSEIPTPFGNISVSSTFWKNAFLMSMCVGVFIFLLNANFFKYEEQRNCFALLVFVSLLWSTEVKTFFFLITD